MKGVDLIDHTSIFLLRTINHCVILVLGILDLVFLFRQPHIRKLGSRQPGITFEIEDTLCVQPLILLGVHQGYISRETNLSYPFLTLTQIMI